MNEEQSTKSSVSVGEFARALIKHSFDNQLNWGNEQIATKVVAKFAEHEISVKTSAACIAWYKNDMRKKGLLPKGTGGSQKRIVIDLDELMLEE